MLTGACSVALVADDLVPPNRERVEMRISLICISLVVEDAIGGCILNQERFFRRRGDDVRIYVAHPPRDLPAEVKTITYTVTRQELAAGKSEHFHLSDLYIYHYSGYDDLMESIRDINQGTVVFYYHNVTPPELWGSATNQELVQRGTLGKMLVHFAHLSIADSSYSKQDLVDNVGYDADRIHVLPLAVSLERFTPGEKDAKLVRRYKLEGHKVLLFVGRMAGNKRIDLLVEALAQVKTEIPNTKLLLVGDNRSSRAYRQMAAAARCRAEELGIVRDVIWTGRVDELVPYFRLADVYVTASLHEGFGVPLIEAMACGVPVVATRIGAMPWVLGESGLLCEPGDAQDLADKVKTVLKDADQYEALVNHGLMRARAFSLERYEAGLAKILDRAAAQTLPETAGQLGSRIDEEPTPGTTRLGGPQSVDRAPSSSGGTLAAKWTAARLNLYSTAWVSPHLPIAWPTWPKGLWPKVVSRSSCGRYLPGWTSRSLGGASP